MTTFYICRHGQSENNKLGRLSGWIDTPLTAAGIENALTSAKKLANANPDVIISSDLGRAFVTAYTIARQLGYTKEIYRDSHLRDVNYGELANAPISAYPPGMTPLQNADYTPANGESLTQMQQRVMQGLTAICERYASQTILIVAHDGTINAVRAAHTGLNIGIVDAKRANGHDFVAKATYDNGKVVSFDEIS